MNQVKMTITSNRPLTRDVFELVLSGDASGIIAPGQFVEIAVPGAYLRRPISVCAWDMHTLTLIIKRVGKGTDTLSAMRAGDALDILAGLGNGFQTSLSGDTPLLIGGGVGAPPMYALAKRLIEEGKSPSVILGFNARAEVFYEDEFKKLGARVRVCTADGTYGDKGFVTDIMTRLDYSFIYACGPIPMFNAIERVARADGQYSLEARMGCGFGACMGCTILTRAGAKRVCKEGPVFGRGDIIWRT